MTLLEEALIEGVNTGRISAKYKEHGLWWTLTPEGHEELIGTDEADSIVYSVPS